MKSVALIPLRKGSKGIPGKNKKLLLYKPLYQWVLDEAVLSKLDEICIFTDDEEIVNQIDITYKTNSKVKCMVRSAESASDTASTEMAMLEYAEKIKYDFDIICLLQATSPLTCHNDIDKCLDKLLVETYDSALTVVETKRFIWSKNGESLNYDYMNRPRRQDFEGLHIENGAIYLTKKHSFLKSRNRISGKIAIVKMEEDTLTEIDEIFDWVTIENLLNLRINK
jgi:CMP-N-acetylneuraminic acid synthetase